MLLPLLVRPQASVMLTRCVRTLRCDATRTPLHSQAEHFLRRRLPPRPHVHSRGTKSRGRKSKSQEEEWKTRNKTVLTYIAAAGVGMIGLSYAAVPLYRLYCQASGLGGMAVAGHDADQVETMTPVKERVLKISFNADTHASMQWNFRPQQTEIFVRTLGLGRWFQARRRWPSTEPRTRRTSPSSASPPTTWCPSRRDNTSTRSSVSASRSSV
ncbi:cytochrome c oxidase assembly protein COX11, mitochondrial isoform X2 [Sander vitreus]